MLLSIKAAAAVPNELEGAIAVPEVEVDVEVPLPFGGTTVLEVSTVEVDIGGLLPPLLGPGVITEVVTTELAGGKVAEPGRAAVPEELVVGVSATMRLLDIVTADEALKGPV